ncbi:phosphotransferase [Clostridium paraputrificum]|uniref:phosphotransferase n=1 Tax=Clostridium paraputrificum TaxID=29363 RepID=UPI003D357E94
MDIKKYNYKLTPLGGLNNSNYKLSINEDKYFYREPKISPSKDFTKEYSILKLLQGKGITPELLYFNQNNGFLISEYLDKGVLTEETQNTTSFINNFSKSLRSFHSLSCDFYFNPFKDIEENLSYLYANKFNISRKINTLINKLKSLEKSLLSNVDLGLCHNDLNPSNVLYRDNKAYLIDFEFSAMGDIFYDLATFSWLLTKEGRIQLLEAYFGEFRSEDYNKLNDYLFVVKIWNALWSYKKSLEGDFSYDYKRGGDLIINDLEHN